ncbi:MAG: hypothetical protein RLY78_3736 [Pseudomonadota bacterium]|jgi:hypothetical protein|uniref:DUF2726 domain-containing protein n=1 Tax=Pseudaquabacterium rugosum TaxID=2984194 RepID=A0ABU9B3I0_9BURK
MQSYLPWLIGAAALAVLAMLYLAWQVYTARRRPAGPPPLPTQWDLLPRPVFTADERRVYRQLREALPHHIVLAKLPLVRLCQPADPKSVRYWYNLLGSINVAYAICSANGRVLAAVDISYDIGLPSRSTRIKQAVLNACKIRYLRCPVDQLPSIPELQLLVPHGTGAARTPQPMPTAAAASPHPAPVAAPAPTSGPAHGAPGPNTSGPTAPIMPATGAATAPRTGTPAAARPDRSTLWQESSAFMDSFFSHQRQFEPSGHGELRTLPVDPLPVNGHASLNGSTAAAGGH